MKDFLNCASDIAVDFAHLTLCFLLAASLFLLYQIGTVKGYYQDEISKVAWNVFWMVIGGVVTCVSLGGNYLRWKMYENSILRSGRKKKSKISSRREEEFERRRSMAITSK